MPRLHAQKRALTIPFAWSTVLKRYVEASEVRRGRACECICEGCNSPVIAKHPKTRRFHFAHDRGSECIVGLETAIHRAAKQIIAEERRLWIPSAIAYSSELWPVMVVREQVVPIEAVDVEKSVGEFRPDLLITGHSGRRMAVEIVVSNPVSEVKRHFYQTAHLSALQIDLSKKRSTITMQSLRNLLVNGACDTRWIHNEMVEICENRLAKEAKPRPITWRKSHKRVGKVPHVDSCPYPFREYPAEDSFFSNAKLDCPRCPYYTAPDNPRKIRFVLCSGHLAERYPEPTSQETDRHSGMWENIAEE
jgi:hypothetical protein